MNESRKLAVIILTADNINKKYNKNYLPKVCHKIGDQTMIEKVINTVLGLNPFKIMLIVTKSNIRMINKILKDKSYSRDISLHLDNNMGIKAAEKCYSNNDILVIPGNSPFVTTKTLFKMMKSSFPLIKIADNLWFLHKEYLDYIGEFNLLNKDKIETFTVPYTEIMEITTNDDLNKARKFMKLIPKKKKSFLKSIEKNIKSIVKNYNKE